MAEKQNYFVWGLCLISAFSVFLPNALPWHLSFAIPFVADIVAWLLMLLVNKNVQRGADLRKYFDACTLGIGADQFAEDIKRQLRENAEKQYSNNPKQAEIQMQNTGADNPPGVYDWYSFSKDIDGLEAQFECQRQNTWWDKKLARERYVAAVTAFAIVLLSFVLLAIRNSNTAQTLLCSAGLFIKLLERIIDNKKYHRLSIEIDGAQKNLGAHLSNEGIAQFQDMINERRCINILGINISHKKQANKLTEMYSKIGNTKQ